MRLFLLPLSTRRSLLYAQRLHVTTRPESGGPVNRAVAWSAKTWARWEKRESGWQHTVVNYGNSAMRRIPYEEWGLKSVPSLSLRRKEEELRGNDKVELVFPTSVIPMGKAELAVKTLATERTKLHWKRLLWCLAGIPITIPLGILPIIPNLPCYYLMYRAWSHWRAISGSRHVQWLIDNRLLQLSPSETLDDIYRPQPETPAYGDQAEREIPVLTHAQAKQIAEQLDLPILETELERAIWQVDKAIHKNDAGVAKDAEATGQKSTDHRLNDKDSKRE